jgi:hypothetical protein
MSWSNRHSDWPNVPAVYMKVSGLVEGYKPVVRRLYDTLGPEGSNHF